MSKIPNLYVCSSVGFSGKTAICLGLALKFRNEGYRVGYFKPVGWEMARDSNDVALDKDAELMKYVLNLEAPLDVVSPVILHSRFLEEFLKHRPVHFEQKIFKAYTECSKRKDLMIIEGPKTLGCGACLEIDPVTIGKKIDANILLVSRVIDDDTICQIVRDCNCIKKSGVKFIGTILNDVPKMTIERVKGFSRPTLEKNEVNVLGIVPENIPLRSPTVQEIYERVGGEILAGKENLDNLVEDFLIGAMTPESALTYFRRSVNKAVITGGDRSDIQLAALQTNTSALILTGNLYPDVRVLARAEHQGVPVLLVPYDTYTTVSKTDEVTGRIKYSDEKKIKLAEKVVEEHVKWKEILKLIGV